MNQNGKSSGLSEAKNNAVNFEHVAIRQQDEAVVTTASRS
jgi:hypothetical protein